ncbi:hypothetical protein HYFRA_00012440 [Hymenoscyphus fraxineus]|uniref:Uncharacterized protein n=1 Tax=Hymenoscyphus fraxineus TaxID=746836 RepID=A0A9N9PUK5_9HELO|nr:hypothetical protein HYFRA_00012440 [Hymenoscyphus fraxineus]
MKLAGLAAQVGFSNPSAEVEAQVRILFWS